MIELNIKNKTGTQIAISLVINGINSTDTNLELVSQPNRGSLIVSLTDCINRSTY